MKKGKQHDSSISLSTQQAEAEFNFGVFYRTVEEHIERFANEARGAFALADITDRVGLLLRTKAKNVRALSGASELLHEMREDREAVSEGRAVAPRSPSRAKVHDGAPARRALSAAARKRISQAQRLRWKKFRERGGTVAKKKKASGIRSYWSRMTPAERSAEVLRRRALRKAA